MDLHIPYWDFLGKFARSNMLHMYLSYYVFHYVSLLNGERASNIKTKATTHLT